MLTLPKSNARLGWTTHVKNKMVYYHISQAQVMRVLRSPERREEGIAPGTVAAMRTVKHNIKAENKTKNRETEVWVMYKLNSQSQNANKKIRQSSSLSILSKLNSKITLISTWRYPGKTKAGERPHIPEGLLEELNRAGIL